LVLSQAPPEFAADVANWIPEIIIPSKRPETHFGPNRTPRIIGNDKARSPGKGFAIGSACLVALALFGAFVTRTHILKVDIMNPICFSGLLLGAMEPYFFSALLMKAVGSAAEDMVQAVRNEYNENKEKFNDPDYKPNVQKCIKISTQSALSQMILPGLLVLSFPIVLGVLFGPKCVSGLLLGIIISGIQLATSAANSGGAWDNTKKSIKKYGVPCNKKEQLINKIYALNKLKAKNEPYSEEELNEYQIELEKYKNKEIVLDESNVEFMKSFKTVEVKSYKKAEKASVVGDTVGDPLKDTSGPSLNILIKLSSILSVVFGNLFLNTSYLHHI